MTLSALFGTLMSSIAVFASSKLTEETSLRQLVYSVGGKVESARIFGDLDSFAYYYMDLQVGSPAQRTSVIIDTGSTVGAFPCNVCRNCGKHIDTAFNFDMSSSASWVGCGDDCNGECKEGHCSYTQSYREGSSLKGWFFNDFVSIGDQDDKNPAVRTTMGCHVEETKLFYSQRANGILGMAPHRQGKGPTLLETLFASSEISKEMFSLCLSPVGGELVVGGFDSKTHKSEIIWTNMQIMQFYKVFPVSCEIAGQTIATDFGKTIVDSGTTLTYFPTAFYKALKEQINISCKNCVKKGENCWNTAEGFPDANLKFQDGAVVSWPAKNGYLGFKKGSQSWCYTFADSESVETVLGASFMINHDVVFDLKNLKIGFANADCPVVTSRPDFTPTFSKTKSAENSTDDGFTVTVVILFAFAIFSLLVIHIINRRLNKEPERQELTAVIGAPYDEEAQWPDRAKV